MTRWLIPLLLTAAWTVTVAILLSPEPAAGFAIPHDEIPKMEQGGDGAQRHEHTLLLGWMFGVLLIAAFGGLIGWGSGTPWGSLMGGLLITTTVIVEGVFAAMCWSYHRQLANPDATPFFGSFPAGTAWQLYGMGSIPFLFVGIYVVFFRRQIVTDRTSAEFPHLSKSSD